MGDAVRRGGDHRVDVGLHDGLLGDGQVRAERFQDARVAVTGGSGVVGLAVVRHLLEAGHRVMALSRSSASAEKLAGLGAEPVSGDVLDYESLLGMVGGCDWVFHVAGINELCTRDRQRMWQVNVEGSRLVAEACRESGVGRLIHTSSAVTIG
ncbi:SDR family NAD(P)-dependent oxidoreductase, partial [bacterium]|nr:SDR family NAD(P)-dependent oxidoreductase [bacterium]